MSPFFPRCSGKNIRIKQVGMMLPDGLRRLCILYNNSNSKRLIEMAIQLNSRIQATLMRGHECFKNLNCKLFMRSENIRHVVSVRRGPCHPRSELQQAEIVFSCDSLLQNLSTFSVGYVCTAAAVTKHIHATTTLLKAKF